MTATTRDPHGARNVIDLQKGIAVLPTAHEADEILALFSEGRRNR